MITPKTDPELLARLVDAARNHVMPPAEVCAQRVSFVYGQMNGALSKERIREILGFEQLPGG